MGFVTSSPKVQSLQRTVVGMRGGGFFYGRCSLIPNNQVGWGLAKDQTFYGFFSGPLPLHHNSATVHSAKVMKEWPKKVAPAKEWL